MSKFKIEIPIRAFEQETVYKIENSFSNIEVMWKFFDKESKFTSFFHVDKKIGLIYKHQINSIKKLLEIFPDNDELKNEYHYYREKAANNFMYDIIIGFEGDVLSEIDIHDNSIIYYDGEVIRNLKRRDINKLKKNIKYEYLDVFYAEKIKKFLIAIVMSILLFKPDIEMNIGRINFFIDNEHYNTEMFFLSQMQNDVFDGYYQIITTKLRFEKIFSWIKKNTDLYDDKHKPHIAFTALTCAFNKEAHESLLYSVIGLESIYSTNDKGISYILQNRINYIFPNITKEQIKHIYKMRSDFVHGKIGINLCPDYSDLSDFKFDDVSFLATALLLETIRRLIENNAETIKFNETITYNFQ